MAASATRADTGLISERGRNALEHVIGDWGCEAPAGLGGGRVALAALVRLTAERAVGRIYRLAHSVSVNAGFRVPLERPARERRFT
ncbi:hypothetical protein PXNS11_150030 [Stutzerimonas xanthomarina]|nr:hypothetical protein PXNS11_150030 [Stutzerimonas xanthomarina]